MIGELIDRIQDAEKRAAALIADAYEKAAAIEAAAQVEIEKIKSAAFDEIAKKVNSVKNTPHSTAPSSHEEGLVVVQEKNKKEAKKYIIAEFNKRYT